MIVNQNISQSFREEILNLSFEIAHLKVDQGREEREAKLWVDLLTNKSIPYEDMDWLNSQVKAKFDHECEESQAEIPGSIGHLSELADILYYAIRLDAMLMTQSADLILFSLTDFSANVIRSACVIKYMLRAQGIKDKDKENKYLARLVKELKQEPEANTFGSPTCPQCSWGYESIIDGYYVCSDSECGCRYPFINRGY